MKENNSNFHGASGAYDTLIYLLPMRLYCSHLSHGLDKILNKSNLRKEWLILACGSCIVMDKSQW